MTIFDFDKPVERRNTDSYKWDTPESQNVQPMWVADMDFRTAPCVIDALRKVVDRGIYGYTYVPDEFYKAADRWFGSRHGNPVDRDMVIYTSGVVPAVSAVIKALTNPGDEVALLTPAYDCFFASIRNNRCKVAECRMKVDANGKYIIDFEALESILSSECVKAFVLCNPHNPGGRVWSAEELRRIGEICIRNDVWVISDDIHCEFVYPPYRYTPVVTLDKNIAARTVQCLAPSKAFNTAGLQIALIVAPDENVRARIDRAINDNEVCDVNPFG
ncbi:MAG: aminotransferase class I/II-fold pyridoxal phosphate-dependent enzyme, partial [Muribaculaceae bacterium]|nr:aminotransferase class I/II-fold pyridoxal phosphate-dependent enzyme [Muribaculaceae bacterium]